MWSKLSAGWPSLASTHWCKPFISLVSAVNLAKLLGMSSWQWPSASGPPKAMVVSEPLVLSLLSRPVVSVSSTWRLMSLSTGCHAPLVGSHSVNLICNAINLRSISHLIKCKLTKEHLLGLSYLYILSMQL